MPDMLDFNTGNRGAGCSGSWSLLDRPKTEKLGKVYVAIKIWGNYHQLPNFQAQHGTSTNEEEAMQIIQFSN